MRYKSFFCKGRGACNGIVVGCVVILVMLQAQAEAQNWSERSRQINSRKISKNEALERNESRELDRRNKLSMRRIRPAMPGVDWNADPTAIPYMLYQVNRRTDLPVYIDNDGLDVASNELFDFTTIYLTSHGLWTFNEKEIKNLRAWLKRGGTLLLDDCYNRGSAFSDAVPVEVPRLIPGAESHLVLASDPVVEDVFRLGYATPWPDKEAKVRPWQYYLLDGRPAVFFTPNDDGCGWEVSTPPTASNPIGEGIGHGGDNKARERMYQWIASWMLYTYTH